MPKKDNLFKDYGQNQLSLLPPSLDSLISPHHPVRLVSEVIDGIDLASIMSRYPGGGASSYHPRMMLKVLVYGYIRNTYSSRKLELAIAEHIHFMWLAGGNRPDHHSINRFRSERLKGVLKEVFSQVVLSLHEAGYLSIKDVYTDGTKLEAYANRYTFVWAKSIQTNKARIAQQLEELWSYAESVAKEELMDTSPCDFDHLEPEAVEKTIEAIDKALKSQEKGKGDKKKKQTVSYGKNNWPDALRRYEAQENILGDRNSYSKTDPDATFMRMKEDHMKNGQLKPAYNVQMSSNNQFLIHYSIHSNPTDTLTLKPHLAGFKEQHGSLPEQITADAGYGSEENYTYLEEQEIEAFVKYNYFHKEAKASFQQKRPFHPNTLHYNEAEEVYICPMGQRMNNMGTFQRKTSSGFEQTLTKYQAQNCQGCPLHTSCHKAKANRIIEVNHALNRHRQLARERLTSEEGIEKRKKRPQEIEAVFGILKQNHGFRRCSLRGKQKVEIEVGLHALAHNFRKWAAVLLQKPTKIPLFPISHYPTA